MNGTGGAPLIGALVRGQEGDALDWHPLHRGNKKTLKTQAESKSRMDSLNSVSMARARASRRDAEKREHGAGSGAGSGGVLGAAAGSGAYQGPEYERNLGYGDAFHQARLDLHNSESGQHADARRRIDENARTLATGFVPKQGSPRYTTGGLPNGPAPTHHVPEQEIQNLHGYARKGGLSGTRFRHSPWQGNHQSIVTDSGVAGSVTKRDPQGVRAAAPRPFGGPSGASRQGGGGGGGAGRVGGGERVRGAVDHHKWGLNCILNPT